MIKKKGLTRYFVYDIICMYIENMLQGNYNFMGKYQIEVKQLVEPFVYQTPKGIHQIYNVDHYECPRDIIDVLQWGDVQWQYMDNMFEDCKNITTFSATDKPDLSKCTTMKDMFRGAENFNGPIGDCDVSNIENMEYLFEGAKSFNQALSIWDVSNVTDMEGMFSLAEQFNQDLSNWDVINVKDLSYMFNRTYCFDQDLSGWNISNAEYTQGIFEKSAIQENHKPKFTQ